MENSTPICPRPDLPTLPEAARRLGIDVKRLREARDGGALPVFVLGNRWQRVAWVDVLAWLETRRRLKPDATVGAE